MIALLINLVIVCIVLGLAWYILSIVPLPPPIKQVATVIFVVIAALALIYILLGVAGGHHVAFYGP